MGRSRYSAGGSKSSSSSSSSGSSSSGSSGGSTSRRTSSSSSKTSSSGSSSSGSSSKSSGGSTGGTGGSNSGSSKSSSGSSKSSSSGSSGGSKSSSSGGSSSRGGGSSYSVTSGMSNVKVVSLASSATAVTPSQHQAALNLQKITQIENKKQQEYFKNLTAGNISIAEALLNPRTEQSYFNSGQSVDVSGTSINLPQFIAQAGYDVNQPEVIPNSLFSPQSINVTGSSVREIAKEREIQLKAGISSNLDLTSATSMNSWISSNPQREINMGKPSINYGFTANESSIPQDNEVQTQDLGGNIQRQETDVNTNVEGQSTLDYSLPQVTTSISTTGIVLAGIAALFLLGKRK